MACTTILIGKSASYDGSTIVARNEDSPNGQFEPKRLTVVHPEDQPRTYTSTASHLTIELPDDPMRYTAVPDAIPGHGPWAAAGFNERNVGMSATETITSNPRVLGADPLVTYRPPRASRASPAMWPSSPAASARGHGHARAALLTSARDGVRRLGRSWSATAPTR